MNHRKVFQMAVAAAGLAAVSSANADEGPQPAGFYVGAGLGQHRLESDDIDGVTLKGDDTAVTLFGGYRVNQYFSAELGYIDGGEPEDTVQGVNVKFDTSALEAAVIGTLPLGPQFVVFGRVGILKWDVKATLTDGFTTLQADDDGSDFSYGVGGMWDLGHAGQIRGQWRSADLDGVDLNLIDVSYIWKF